MSGGVAYRSARRRLLVMAEQERAAICGALLAVVQRVSRASNACIRVGAQALSESDPRALAVALRPSAGLVPGVDRECCS
jgi:hypothetical protein